MAKRKKTSRGGSFRGKIKKGRTKAKQTHFQKNRSPRRRVNP